MVGHRVLFAIGVAATCFIAVRPVAADPVSWQFSVLLDPLVTGPTELFFGTRLKGGQRISGSLTFDPDALRLHEFQISQSITFDVGSRPKFNARVIFFKSPTTSGTGLSAFGSSPPPVRLSVPLYASAPRRQDVERVCRWCRTSSAPPRGVHYAPVPVRRSWLL
jgi:hypothetical protein